MRGKTQYRIEFLDHSNILVKAITAAAGSPADAFLLVVAGDAGAFPATARMRWPLHAVTARVIDRDGRQRLTVAKPDRRR